MDGRKPVHMCTNVPVFHSLLPSLCFLCFLLSYPLPSTLCIITTKSTSAALVVFYSYRNDRHAPCAALFLYGMHTLTLNSELPERPPRIWFPQTLGPKWSWLGGYSRAPQSSRFTFVPYVFSCSYLHLVPDPLPKPSLFLFVLRASIDCHSLNVFHSTLRYLHCTDSSTVPPHTGR